MSLWRVIAPNFHLLVNFMLILFKLKYKLHVVSKTLFRCHIVNQFNEGLYDIIIASDENLLLDPKTKPQEQEKKKEKRSETRPQIDASLIHNKCILFTLISWIKCLLNNKCKNVTFLEKYLIYFVFNVYALVGLKLVSLPFYV